MNRLPIPIRFICFVLGLAATYSNVVLWDSEFVNPNMALATNIAMSGAAIMLLGMGVWSSTENPWFIKLMFLGIATFLVGATAVMGLGEGSKPFPSFPSFLFFVSIAMGLGVLFTPRRCFSS